MRVFVVDRGQRLGTPDGHQVLGFSMYEAELRRALGVELESATLKNLPDIKREVLSRRPDVAIILISWSIPPEEAARFFEDLKAEASPTRIVFLDYYAPTCSPHFGVMNHVDVYVKRQVLRDRDRYQDELAGGFVLTDFLSRNLHYPLDGWNFGSRPDPAHLHKLVSGWNLGVTPRYRTLLKITQHVHALWPMRPIDINRRIGTFNPNSKREWYHEYREFALQKLETLATRYRLSGNTRVSTPRYLLDLAKSKLVVSPFGWGELCFRDYEAVALGALLVKPSMEHLTTSPDIFKPFETYVPVAWDLSDLADACEEYLRQPKKAMTIVRNAQETLRDYYEKGGFVDDLRRVLNMIPQA